MLIFHTLIDRNWATPQSEVRIAKDYAEITRMLWELSDHAVFEYSQICANIKWWIIECIEKWEWDQEYIMTFDKFQCILAQDHFSLMNIIDMSRWQAQIIDTDTTSETNFYLD